MRIAFLLLLLLYSSPVFPLECIMTDEERTKASAAVFTGIVRDIRQVKTLESDSLWRAEVEIAAVIKQDTNLPKTAFVYYEQGLRAEYDGVVHISARVCPAYPCMTTGDKLKMWCVRRDIGGFKQVLVVPTSSWVSKQ